MSRIELEQISENEVEVVLPPETPMEMVQQLTKGLAARGLIEDLAKSTVSVRYFKRPIDKANTVADELIKSLSRLAKDDELPYWHPKAQMANQRRIKDVEIGERRAKLGIKQPTNMSPAPEPHIAPDTPTIKPPAPAPGAVSVNTAPKMYDHTPQSQNTAGGTGKRYAYINDPVSQSEHVEGCQCDKCLEMRKSNYGPKGAGQYNAADNARRKANNVGDAADIGPNSNVKAYSTKPGQMSGKAQADLTARLQAAKNKKQPVTIWSPEQIQAEERKRGLKKSEWGQHLPFPSAEEEIMKFAKSNIPSGEEAAANQLANLMLGKQMLGKDAHPVVKAMMAPPPPQPTDEQMFGHLVVTEEMAKAQEQQWGNTFNNWMQEAAKPITQRFASQAEEEAYWANIKVSDRDDGQSGF